METKPQQNTLAEIILDKCKNKSKNSTSIDYLEN